MTFTATPQTVFFAHVLRVAQEAAKPVYSTDTESAARKERERQIRWAEDYTHSEDPDYDWCHVCSRATDHFGEHSDEQLLAFYHGKGRMFRR